MLGISRAGFEARTIGQLLQLDPDTLEAWGRQPGTAPRSVRRLDGSVLWLRVEAGRHAPGFAQRSAAAVATPDAASDALAEIDTGDGAMRAAIDRARRVLDKPIALLLQGESGAGKEVFARAIHASGLRRAGPFVAVNCAALPEALLESELFGYEKGAFTGAAGRKEGRFEMADGGTLFLDEVADLSPVTQPKILRVLQEGEFERLGGTRTMRVDVRIVAATNQDLAQMVKDKRFREDLFYRLNVITINVPPLRDRREDIPMLAHHFVRVYAAKNNRKLEGLTDEAVRQLEAYSWPGNVRELENVVERAVVLARGGRIEVADLPPEIAGATPLPEGMLSIRVGTPLAEVEARLLEETLRVTKGNKTLTARLLGIDVRTVARKLERQESELAGHSPVDPEPA
jgi:two-component system response regulator HydG